MRIAKLSSLEYRKEVHLKRQRHFGCLLWNRAQIEEGGNGGTVQQRGQGRMEVCQRPQQESLRKWQAMRIVSTRQEEFLLLGSSCGCRRKSN